VFVIYENENSPTLHFYEQWLNWNWVSNRAKSNGQRALACLGSVRNSSSI